MKLDDDIRQELMNIEKETEEELAYVNQDMKSLFDKCIKEGKRVVITTDMYLNDAELEKILNKSGIKGYERIFVSSELRVNKKKGQLFDYILKSLKLNNTDVIHIGDNAWGDYVIPEKKRIKAFLYSKKKSIIR